MLKFSENFKYPCFLRLSWHTNILHWKILAVLMFLFTEQQGSALLFSLANLQSYGKIILNLSN